MQFLDEQSTTLVIQNAVPWESCEVTDSRIDIGEDDITTGGVPTRASILPSRRGTSLEARIIFVGVLMCPQGSHPPERLLAVFAAVWHFSGMHSLMNSQIVWTGVELTALRAGIGRVCGLSTRSRPRAGS